MLTQQGPAWDAVSDMRSRWGVSARAELPPASSNSPNNPYPEHWPEEYADQRPERWGLDLDTLRDQIVPEAYRWGPVDTSWRSFLAAWVLFARAKAPRRPALYRTSGGTGQPDATIVSSVSPELCL
jgi:hypothetical protein